MSNAIVIAIANANPFVAKDGKIWHTLAIDEAQAITLIDCLITAVEHNQALAKEQPERTTASRPSKQSRKREQT